MFLNGLDMNYIPLMEESGHKWIDEGKQGIEDLFSFFRNRGANCLRVRIWVGDSGPSRLPYAMSLADRACKADLKIQPTIFLSDVWSDLYKQPQPKIWAPFGFNDKLKLIEAHTSKAIKELMSMRDRCAYYQIGNEIDYGLCGIFAHDKKKRRDHEWLKRRIWPLEAKVLKEAIRAIRIHDEKPIALHLGKWWDLKLSESFLSSMDEFGVCYEIVCFSFYPAMFSSGFDPLVQLMELAKSSGKAMAIAEYAYPSKPPKGLLWYMNKPSADYPLTPEGQSSWIRDFLTQCLKLNIRGAFYWSPELYLTKYDNDRVPIEMPLGFGWGPMSFFDEDGCIRPCASSLKYGVRDV